VKINNTSTQRRQYAPGCAAKGDLYLDAFEALGMVLEAHRYGPRAGDTGAYNCRPITGGTGLTLHAFGPGSKFQFWNGVKIATSLAVDINWLTNAYTRGPLITDMPLAMRNDIKAIRTNSGRQLFGLGADYRSVKDAMHIEIVCDLADLRSGINWTTVRSKKIPKPVDPNKGRKWVDFVAGATDKGIFGKGGYNNRIAAMEINLGILGYYKGKIDGIYGPMLTHAWVAFQVDQNKLAPRDPRWIDRSSRVTLSEFKALQSWVDIRSARK
jgi:hypothetical protein